MASKMRGLSGRLAILTVLPVLGTMILIWLYASGLSSQSKLLTKFVDERLPKASLVNKIRADQYSTFRALSIAALNAPGSPARESALQDAAASLASFAEDHKKYFELKNSEKMMKATQKWREHAPLYIEGAEKIIADLRHSSPTTEADARTRLAGSLAESSQEISAGTAKAADIINFHNAEFVNKANAESAVLQRNLLIGSVVGALFLLALGFFIGKRLASVLTMIAASLKAASVQLRSGSTQLSGASQQVSSGCVSSASSLEETVAAVEELTSMVKMNNQSVKDANDLSRSSRDSALNGGGNIRELLNAMSEIAEGSKKTGQIIQVIEEIAFQTNLLALNAAVEAARAGEQGRGFAVVADAVRGLAQRSAEASKESAQLINGSITTINRGLSLAKVSSESIEQILKSVEKVADLNTQVATANDEQDKGIHSIGLALNHLDRSTQGNAAASEEVAKSAGDVADQAVRLEELVTELEVMVFGEKAA